MWRMIHCRYYLGGGFLVYEDVWHLKVAVVAELRDILEMGLGKGVSVKQDSDLGISVLLMMLKKLTLISCHKHSVHLHFCILMQSVIKIGPYKAAFDW